MQLRKQRHKPSRYREPDDITLPAKATYVHEEVLFNPYLRPACFPTLSLDQSLSEDSESEGKDNSSTQVIHSAPICRDPRVWRVQEDKMKEQYESCVPYNPHRSSYCDDPNNGKVERITLPAIKRLEWSDLSEGMQLIIVMEFCRKMDFTDVVSFFQLQDDDLCAFIDLVEREYQRIIDTDKRIRSCAAKHADLKMKENYTQEEWDLIGAEMVGGLVPTNFIITQTQIDQAKRFLLDFRYREEFSEVVLEEFTIPASEAESGDEEGNNDRLGVSEEGVNSHNGASNQKRKMVRYIFDDYDEVPPFEVWNCVIETLPRYAGTSTFITGLAFEADVFRLYYEAMEDFLREIYPDTYKKMIKAKKVESGEGILQQDQTQEGIFNIPASDQEHFPAFGPWASTKKALQPLNIWSEEPTVPAAPTSTLLSSIAAVLPNQTLNYPLPSKKYRKSTEPQHTPQIYIPLSTEFTPSVALNQVHSRTTPSKRCKKNAPPQHTPRKSTPPIPGRKPKTGPFSQEDKSRGSRDQQKGVPPRNRLRQVTNADEITSAKSTPRLLPVMNNPLTETAVRQASSTLSNNKVFAAPENRKPLSIGQNHVCSRKQASQFIPSTITSPVIDALPAQKTAFRDGQPAGTLSLQPLQSTPGVGSTQFSPIKQDHQQPQYTHVHLQPGMSTSQEQLIEEQNAARRKQIEIFAAKNRITIPQALAMRKQKQQQLELAAAKHGVTVAQLLEKQKQKWKSIELEASKHGLTVSKHVEIQKLKQKQTELGVAEHGMIASQSVDRQKKQKQQVETAAAKHGLTAPYLQAMQDQVKIEAKKKGMTEHQYIQHIRVLRNTQQQARQQAHQHSIDPEASHFQTSAVYPKDRDSHSPAQAQAQCYYHDQAQAQQQAMRPQNPRMQDQTPRPYASVANFHTRTTTSSPPTSHPNNGTSSTYSHSPQTAALTFKKRRMEADDMPLTKKQRLD